MFIKLRIGDIRQPRSSLECSGGNCTQHCKAGSNVCDMYCNAGQCAQTCDVTTCHRTRAQIQKRLNCYGNGPCCKRFMSLGTFHICCGEGTLRTCTRCPKHQCTTSDIYPSNVITYITPTATQVFTTQGSTVQGTENSQAYREYH